MLNPDFKEMSSAFNEEGVEFLVVGAYAMAAHGVVRATGDVAFWIRPSEKNAERVIRSLVRFGAPSIEFEEAWETRITTRIGGVEVPVLGYAARPT